MIDDPIVEEVHQTRRRIFAECNGDLDRLIARLKAADSENKDHHFIRRLDSASATK